MDRGAWGTTVHGCAKSQTNTFVSFHFTTNIATLVVVVLAINK